MSWIGRVLRAPARWWSRSLSFRVVTNSVLAALAVFGVTGWLLVDQSTRGILEAKTDQSVSEASAVLEGMQASLRDADETSFDTLLEVLEEAVADWRGRDVPFWAFLALPEDDFPEEGTPD